MLLPAISLALISQSLYLVLAVPPNLIPNGSFEQGLDPWKSYGDSAVIQTLALDQGREGGNAGKLDCASFNGSKPSSHAMIAQAGAFQVRKDQWYRFSCWAKSQGLSGGQVSVALSDTKVWDNAGLSMALTPGPDWRRFETLFQANRNITDNGRLQFWYGETGTLWLDDVSIEETSIPAPVFTNRLPLTSSRNKIPNASFEAGSKGWSSLGQDVGWGNLTGLFGRVEKGNAFHGDQSLRIELGPGKTITTYFDYFDPVAVEQKSPLAANLGWIPVEKGKKYTLSAYLKADRDGVPAQLKVVMGRPMSWSFSHDEKVVLTKDWKRYSVAFEAMTSDLHVAVGPDLSGSSHTEASVWVDAVQLEVGLASNPFEVSELKPAPSRFKALENRVPYSQPDSPFGVNHGPVSAELLRKHKDAGILWVRDWSLKWEDIESKPGVFNFAKVEPQIDRVLKEGMKVVCLLPPFPSANWSSSAPENPDGGTDMGDHPKMPYAPKDPALLGRFITKTVEHFKGRVSTWEFLNEPLFTSYSLPESKGYTAKDYVKLLKVARDAVKKADPAATLIGGIGGDPDNRTKEFMEAGGLDLVDKLNLHIYPGFRAPESYIPEMEKLNALMDKHGGRKPIWLTEYSYYGVDQKPWEPFISSAGNWAGERLLRDEQEAAEYSVKFAVIMLASGVEKIFYHSGASASVNEDPLESCLLGREGLPRKAYAAQAVLAEMLGEKPIFRGKGGEGLGMIVYRFQGGPNAVNVCWKDPDSAKKNYEFSPDPGLKVFDLMGNLIRESVVHLGTSPVYVVANFSIMH